MDLIMGNPHSSRFQTDERERGMILWSGGGTAMVVPRRPSWRTPMCLASNVNTEELRAQLGQLHSEAETARAKANNARLRLLRLSEAAEKLKRQAAINVQTGKEDDARELLFQKKKVMEALEKSKHRIEFLDELSTKLNEAISLKEGQLIGNVSLDLEVVREDAFSPVRIVSPTAEVAENLEVGKEFVSNDLKEETPLLKDSQASLPVEPEGEDLREPLNRGAWNEDETLSSLKGITSFNSFLEHLDHQLKKIEAELITILRISTLVVDGQEKSRNFKVQKTMELLDSVSGVRQRISSIKMANVEAR
ncbi:hypothetical protein D8674_018899 [Pyrus ussuriensis x Pyrus communis]|uniref:Uncharacterized protein n=1 Tax=Pyrus ussuriensis x Pyrus communis TaxID=2448454 RepID=A0A5N5G6R2_9ROSA|nr:hypothetical protein D8674_018899 [Pyrus ussuriensis x Pyrus communis]